MYDDWGNEIAGPVDHMLLDAVAEPTFLPSPTAFRDDFFWNEALALPSVEDLLFLLKADDPFVLPTQDEHSFLNVKPGSDEDWLTPLSNEADLGEIVVPPPRPGTPSDPNSPFDPNDGWDSRDTSQPPPPPPDPHNDCEDRRADTLSDEFNKKVAQKPDYKRQEYHSVTWRDDNGTLHMTDPMPFNGAYPADPNVLGLDSYSRVVALNHNHPEEVYINGSWVPASHGWIHGGDWQTARWWIQNHNLDPDNFSIYINFQGQVREYDWRHNANRPVFDDLRDEDAQQSGDYRPGSAC